MSGTELQSVNCTFQWCIDYVDITAFLRYLESIEGEMEKMSHFLAKCVNVSKTVGDTPKLTNRKLHNALSIGIKIDDLELL